MNIPMILQIPMLADERAKRVINVTGSRFGLKNTETGSNYHRPFEKVGIGCLKHVRES
jgi:hypothetical protein